MKSLKISSLLLFALMFVIGIGMYSTIQAQHKPKYTFKIESAYLLNHGTLVDVDPGPGWRGHNLSEDQNGFEISLINGLQFNHKIFVGIGLGYLNFEGINGVLAFGDLEYLPFQRKISPLINLKIGHSHIWNQYENGTGVVAVMASVGLNYKLSKTVALYIKVGASHNQEAFMTPLHVGVRL